MQLTNQEIINALNALDEIKDKDLPILITYQIVDNIDRLLGAYRPYEQAMKKAKNQEEIKKLLEQSREVEIERINKQELVDCAATLTPAQLANLRVLING